MYYFVILLLISSVFTTSCFNGANAPVTREDDKVRIELESDIKQLEVDGYIIDNQVHIARNRLQELSISPKMYDIAKKDLYQKESYYSQISQQIAYLKIKLNNREKYFLDNQAALSKERLDKEYAQLLIDKEANPTKYPWRIPAMRQMAPAKAKSDH